MAETLTPVPEDVQRQQARQSRVARFEMLAVDRTTDVHRWIARAESVGLRAPSLTTEMGALDTVIAEGVEVPIVDPKKDLGWREARLEDLDLPRLAADFGLNPDRLQLVASHMVQEGLLKSSAPKNSIKVDLGPRVVSWDPRYA